MKTNLFTRLIDGSEAKFNALEVSQAKAKILSVEEKIKAKANLGSKDLIVGKKVVGINDSAINTDKIETFLDDCIDEKVKDGSHIVYNMITVWRKIYVSLLALSQVNPNGKVSEYAIELANGVVAQIVMGKDRKSDFEHVYHYLFGGKIGSKYVKPCDDLESDLDHATEVREAFEEVGFNLNSLREFFYGLQGSLKEAVGYTKLELKDLVKVSQKAVSIKLLNGKSTTLAWNTLQAKLEYANQVVIACTRTNKETGELVAQLKTSNTICALLCVGMLHNSGVDVSGLKEHSNAYAVVLMEEDQGLVSWLKKPFYEGLTHQEQISDLGVITKAVSDRLAKHFTPIHKKEVYAKHGYVVRPNTIVHNDNAFSDAKGNSAEDYGKLAVRLSKCAQATHKATYNTTVHVLALIPTPDMGSAQYEFNAELIRGLVDGHITASQEMFNNTGVVRCVSGSNVGESGQKTMVGSPLMGLTTEAMASVVTSLIGWKGNYAISGLSSAKAKSFKLEEGFEVQEVEYKGQTVKVGLKSSKETLMITDSAVSEALEFNPENLVKLTGMEAAKDTFKRRVMNHKSSTVFELLYNQRLENETLLDAVKRLTENGTLRSKKGRSRTNVQFLTALEAQFSREVAESVITTLVAQNKAIEYRSAVALATEVAASHQRNTGLDSFEVDMKEFAESIRATQAELGFLFENASQQVYNTEIVKGVADYLLAGGKDLVTFVSENKSVTIRLTQKMFDSVEAVERFGHVKVSGLLAEVLYAVHKGLVLVTKETDPNETAVVTDACANIMVKDIETARDNHIGKELTRIPTEGVNGLVIGSALLEGNDILSAGAIKAQAQAKSSFAERVFAFYFKSPVLWEGSLTLARVLGLRDIVRLFDESATGTSKLDMDMNNFTILNGNTMYQSPEKIVGNGNDSDGDRSSLIFCGESAIVGYKTTVKKLDRSAFIDAMDESVAVGGKVATAKWEEEVDGLYIDSLASKLTTNSKGKLFLTEMTKAILASVHETKNVALYTTAQSRLLTGKEDFVRGGKDYIVKDATSKVMKGVATRLNVSKPLVNASDFALDVFMNEVWKFTTDVLGTIVNIDAMDQIKHGNGKTAVKLAELLNPMSVYYANQDRENEDGTVTKTSVQGGNSQKYNDHLKTAEIIMFSDKYHNLSLNRLLDCLPEGIKESELKSYITKIMFAGLEAVGEGLVSRPSFSSFLVKDHENGFETVLRDLTDKEIKLSSSNDIVSYTLTQAFKLRKNRLTVVR